jgi:hypothetical protein
VVLPRRQLMDDSAIMDFLLSYVGKFDLYVEDHCPAYVRYCFEEPMDAADLPVALRAAKRAVQARGLTSDNPFREEPTIP